MHFAPIHVEISEEAAVQLASKELVQLVVQDQLLLRRNVEADWQTNVSAVSGGS